MLRRRARTLLALCAALVAILPTVQQPWDVVIVRDQPHGPTSELALARLLSRRLNNVGPRSDVKVDFPTLAALAANVYEPPDLYDEGCSPDSPGRIRLGPKWEQLYGWSYPDACNSALSGLHYEVWSAYNSEGIGCQVVVFRGTVPDKLSHWCSNLRNARLPICDPRSDQYLGVVSLIDQVLTGIYDEWGPDRYTVTVGHSLGGGLAELAARSSFINEAFVFDPSPVTGMEIAEAVVTAAEGGETASAEAFFKDSGCTFDGSNNLPNGSGVAIHRLYEHGEVLEPLRRLSAWVAREPPRPDEKVVEYRTNLLHGNPLKQHSMKSLACAMLAARRQTPASRSDSPQR